MTRCDGIRDLRHHVDIFYLIFTVLSFDLTETVYYIRAHALLIYFPNHENDNLLVYLLEYNIETFCDHTREIQTENHVLVWQII